MSRACCKTYAFTFLAILFAVRVLGLFKKAPSEVKPSGMRRF